ncbi:hypothetical protein [Streptomyces sp. NBC_01304]|uniref:hypothetical protein n=1 Tax=Streptomyces sp. NBC_01304 TaxID=2903818 RepID=UPI002E13F10A|nr:hypothetical protein OG430_32945 [Streptomyces sp. NBC_01304]
MTYDAERTITVGDITIHARTSNPITLGLNVITSGQVAVRAPRHAINTQAADLARRHRRWIHRPFKASSPSRLPARQGP